MKEYIEKNKLLEQIKEWEELARQRVCDTPWDSPAYPRYRAQCDERERLREMVANASCEDVIPVVRVHYLQEVASVPVPERLYDVVFDECSPEGSYITSYPTEGLYIAWAGDYIPVEEVGQSAFATLEEAEKKLHAKLENLGAKERSMMHDL